MLRSVGVLDFRLRHDYLRDQAMKAFLDPLAVAWLGLLLFAGAQIVRRRYRPACLLLAVACAASLVQAADIPGRLLAHLERPYLFDPHKTLPAADAVVVLGGYLEPFPETYTGIEFHEQVDRLLTGAALVRAGKGSVLLLGGTTLAHPVGPSEAETAKSFLQSWHLVSVPIQLLGARSNTHDEALRCAELAKSNGWTRLYLVSSAAHLDRATRVFHRLGLEVTPIGCDFRAVDRFSGRSRLTCVPNTGSLLALRSWLYQGLRFFLLSGPRVDLMGGGAHENRLNFFASGRNLIWLHDS